MNLFTYLMAKKGKKILPHKNDLFSYLLAIHKVKSSEATGTEIEINAKSRNIISLTLNKESSQDGTPTTDVPIEVNTIKDSLNIVVSNGSVSNTYTINLGDNEICGIGDYKDELLIDKTGHCYLNKKIGKRIFDGTQTGYAKFRTKTDTIYWECDQNIYQNPESASYKPVGLCNRLTAETGNNLYSNDVEGFTFTTSKFRFSLSNTIADNADDLKTWLSENTLIVYGLLKTEQSIDLDVVIDLKLFQGTNVITNSENATMTIKYY